jgi:uncharacterized membrane protein YqiK
MNIGMAEILSGIGLALCLFLMLRLVLPARARSALDAAGRRLMARLRRRPAPKRALTEREAARLAEEAIRRAREGREKEKETSAKESGKWDGNVFRLRSKKPRKPH